MKKLFSVLMFLLISAFAANLYAETARKPILLIMIAEQNIEGKKSWWWSTEVDLSVLEGVLSQKLIRQGFQILDPSYVNKVIEKKKAYRNLDLNDKDSIKLADIVGADVVILGKAIASAGGRVPGSTAMRSCFANVTAKAIRVSDGMVLSHLSASGSTTHMDVITGGREALEAAGEELADKIVQASSEWKITFEEKKPKPEAEVIFKEKKSDREIKIPVPTKFIQPKPME